MEIVGQANLDSHIHSKKWQKDMLDDDHDNLLRTVEEEFFLGSLGLNDQKSAAIKDIWLN